MLSLTLAVFGAAACSSTPGTDGGTTTSSTSAGSTTSGSGTTTAGTTTSGGGTTTAGTTTTGTGTTTAGSTTTGTGTTSSGTTGGTTGSFTTYVDGGCWVTPTRDPNAQNFQLMNGCTSAQGVTLPSVTLPCWDGGVTGSSNLPTDFYNSGFLPGPNNNITCPTT
jgi:hypothetical protein